MQLSVVWGRGGRNVGTCVFANLFIYTLKNFLSFSSSWITGQHWWFTTRLNIMIASPSVLIAYNCKVNWETEHNPRGCFVLLSSNWTLGNPAFSTRQFQHVTYSRIWGWSAVFLNLGIVLNKTTIIVILSIRKLIMKNVPAESQGLYLEVQFPPFGAANGPWNEVAPVLTPCLCPQVFRCVGVAPEVSQPHPDRSLAGDFPRIRYWPVSGTPDAARETGERWDCRGLFKNYYY